MRRYWEIDALRGLMLLLMTVTHLPSRLTDPLGQPFGFVSAAEGFVLLSAFVCGLHYSRIGLQQGIEPMRRAFWRRALTIWLVQAATLLGVFAAIGALGSRIDPPAVKNLLSWFLADPQAGLVWSLLLVYEPPLLDILPLYVFFMLLSPWVLAFALRHGWTAVLLASVLLWTLAQFGLSEWLHAAAARWLGLPVPFHETGAFNAFAWQLLWFAGLWLGASRNAPSARPLRSPPWLVALAIAVVLVGLYWRHGGGHGQAPFGADVARNLLFDKWQLGPLRLLNLAALGVVVLHFGPALLRRMPRLHRLEALGRASLPVFCAQLVAVLAVLALQGDSQVARPWWGDALLLAAVWAGLQGVAWVTARWAGRGRTVVLTGGAA